jgi:hypothetical protein
MDVLEPGKMVYFTSESDVSSTLSTKSGREHETNPERDGSEL